MKKAIVLAAFVALAPFFAFADLPPSKIQHVTIVLLPPVSYFITRYAARADMDQPG